MRSPPAPARGGAAGRRAGERHRGHDRGPALPIANHARGDAEMIVETLQLDPASGRFRARLHVGLDRAARAVSLALQGRGAAGGRPGAASAAARGSRPTHSRCAGCPTARPAAAVRDAAALVGQEARCSLPAGRPLLSATCVHPPLVQRGEPSPCSTRRRGPGAHGGRGRRGGAREGDAVRVLNPTAADCSAAVTVAGELRPRPGAGGAADERPAGLAALPARPAGRLQHPPGWPMSAAPRAGADREPGRAQRLPAISLPCPSPSRRAPGRTRCGGKGPGASSATSGPAGWATC